MSIAAPPKMYDFMSKSARLRLVRVAELVQPEPLGGGYRTIRKPVRYEFTAGRLQVHEGQDMLPTGPPDYSDPEMKATMEDAVAWLRRHRLYNSQGAAGEGFYEIGREPERLQPYEEDVREQILVAAVDLQEDMLEEILVAERGGHNRAPLVREGEKALERVRQTKAAIQAEQAKQAAENAGNGAETSKPAKAPAKAKTATAKDAAA